jgi:dihydrofolate reductase
MIRLIAAIDQKRGIAKAGLQPWKIPHDERYFLEKTSQFGGNVLMGKKTFEVIGHPLKNRQNFVVAREGEYSGVEMVRDLADFIKNFKEDIWIIGGASIFGQTIHKADELYLTHIDADFGCDQFFPEYKQFKAIEKSEIQEENGFRFTYALYKNLP